MGKKKFNTVQKTNKVNNRKIIKNSKINKYNIVFINLQLIFTLLIIILGIAYFIDHDYDKWFELMLGIDLIIMGYNNYLIYKRAYFTTMYMIVGIIVIIISIFNFLGVVL